MTTEQLILKEIKRIPEPMLQEVLDFIRFLETKLATKGLEAAIVSESSLAKDWLVKEEDKAWRNL